MPRFRFHLFAGACAVFLCLAAAAQTADGFQSIVQSANAARDAGNADEAIRDYGKALALKPDWVEGWWDLGVTQYQANHYADAVASLRELTVLAPSAGAGWSLLGLSEFEAADYADALASLEKAQKLGGINDPEIAHVSAYHLALLLIRAGDFDLATALLHSVFGKSTSPQVKTALGLALLRVPLLPHEVDPAQDALIQAAGEAATSADELTALGALIQQYPRIPWLHYRYGLALAATGATSDALEQQKAEVEISPASALPWVEISALDLRLKDTQQALSAAKRAVGLDAGSSAAHEALAQALAAAGKTHQAALETRESARLAQTSIQRDPRMIALYEIHSRGVAEGSEAWNTAMQDYSAEQYPEAIAALKGWVEKNPDDGTAWAVMGLSEFALKDYGNARIHLQRGVNLGLKGGAESMQLAEVRLALLLNREGQFDAASSLLTPLAGKPPMAEQTRLALGLAMLRISELPDNLDPTQRELAQSAGAIVELLLASRYAEAFPAFQKLIAEHSATPWLHYAYGDALEALSQYDQAKAEMRAELKISPQSALPWIRLASIDVRQHLPNDALDAARNAVRLAPGSAQAHYEVGRAWLENGDAPKSIVELKKADGISPNIPEVHFALARAYAKANLPEQAAAERAAFVQLKTEQKTQAAAQGGSILNSTPQ